MTGDAKVPLPYLLVGQCQKQATERRVSRNTIPVIVVMLGLLCGTILTVQEQ